jgi:hypothetical protein
MTDKINYFFLVICKLLHLFAHGKYGKPLAGIAESPKLQSLPLYKGKIFWLFRRKSFSPKPLALSFRCLLDCVLSKKEQNMFIFYQPTFLLL